MTKKPVPDERSKEVRDFFDLSTRAEPFSEEEVAMLQEAVDEAGEEHSTYYIDEDGNILDSEGNLTEVKKEDIHSYIPSIDEEADILSTRKREDNPTSLLPDGIPYGRKENNATSFSAGIPYERDGVTLGQMIHVDNIMDYKGVPSGQVDYIRERNFHSLFLATLALGVSLEAEEYKTFIGEGTITHGEAIACKNGLESLLTGNTVQVLDRLLEVEKPLARDMKKESAYLAIFLLFIGTSFLNTDSALIMYLSGFVLAGILFVQLPDWISSIRLAKVSKETTKYIKKLKEVHLESIATNYALVLEKITEIEAEEEL